MLNKRNQKYQILRMFQVGGQMFCKVKFTLSKHEDIFPMEVVNSGEFEDLSLIEKEEQESPKPKTSEDDAKAIKEAVDNGEVEVATITEEAIEPMVEATNPKGMTVLVKVENLETFCEENSLNIESVMAVLDGKQKSHRKWRFKQA